MKEKGGVAGLGGNSADPGNVDVSTPATVEELEVDEERFARPGKTDRQTLGHLVEEKGPITGLADCDEDFLARARGNEDLRFEAGRRHLGGLENLGREQSGLDQKDVGIEMGAFVACPDLGHDAVNLDHLAPGKRTAEGNDIVELEETIRAHPYPEFERGGILGPDYPPDRARVSLSSTTMARLSTTPDRNREPTYAVPSSTGPGRCGRSPRIGEDVDLAGSVGGEGDHPSRRPHLFGPVLGLGGLPVSIQETPQPSPAVVGVEVVTGQFRDGGASIDHPPVIEQVPASECETSTTGSVNPSVSQPSAGSKQWSPSVIGQP